MAGKGSILVVDDSSTMRRLAHLVLEEEGFTVHTAEDGERGLKVAEETVPSLILVDFVMPNMNGYQFCLLAKEHPVLKDIPIILITSKGEEVGAEFTEKFAVADYFIKPFQPEDLVAKVHSILHVTEEPEQVVDAPEDDRPQVRNATLDEIEQSLDSILQRYLSRELPSLMQKSIVEVFKHEGIIKSSAISLSGDFTVFSLFDIFQMMDTARPTGKLSVYSPTLSTEIYLDRGSIVFVSSSKQGGNILNADLLKKRKNIPHEAFNEAYQQWKTSGVPLFVTLETKGWLTEEDIFALVREQIEDAIYSMMEMENGRFFFEKTALPAQLCTSRVRFGTSMFILEAARRIDEKKHASETYHDNNMVFMRQMTDVAMEDFELSVKELSVFSHVDGKRSITDIIAVSGIEEDEVKRILHVLIKVGILKVNKGVTNV